MTDVSIQCVHMHREFYARFRGPSHRTHRAQLSASVCLCREKSLTIPSSPLSENFRESIIATGCSPGVSTHALYWLQFILSDLYFSVTVLYLWSADCKQSNQPPGFCLLEFHLLYNATLKPAVPGREKGLTDWIFSSRRKICVALRLSNDNVFFCLCV